MRASPNIMSLVLLFRSVAAPPTKDHVDGGHENTDVVQSADDYGPSKNENDAGHELGEDLRQLAVGRHGLSNETKHWLNATVPYVIKGRYTSEEKDLIRKAMDTIELWTCVRFVPYSGEQDYIKIKHFNGAGCQSNEGRMGGRQVLALEAPKCFSRIGKVMHELLHALGMIHEHSRPDRDDYVYIYTYNIKPEKREEFDIYTDASTDDFGVPYEYNSIMHYPQYAFTVTGDKTIIPKTLGDPNKSRIGQRMGLSVREAITINRMYDCYYKVNDTEKFSRVLPRVTDTTSSKRDLWNTYFRNIY